MTNTSTTWVRSVHENSKLEVVTHSDPNKVWSDGIPFIQVPNEDVPFINTLTWKVVEGAIIKGDSPRVVTESELNVLKDSAFLEVYTLSENVFKSLTTRNTLSEIQSWETQVKEAEGFLSNPEFSTPLLGGIAEMRGISRKELSEIILKKAYEFNLKRGKLLGLFQLRNREIENSKTPEELRSLVPLGSTINLLLNPPEEDSEKIEEIPKKSVRKSSKKVDAK